MSEYKEYFKYWGKARQRKDGAWECHLLPYHCLDVAAVGQYLADRLGIAEHVAQKLKCEKSAVMPVITFLCAVHDIGKFSDGFQNQIPALVDTLRGVSLNTAYQKKHWSLGHRFWREYADKVFVGDKNTILDFFDSWFSASSGHHGRPPTSEINSYFDAKQFPVEKAIEFVSDVKEIAGMPTDIKFLLKNEQLMKELSWLVAGLMVLADWIGSNTQWFSFQQTEQPLKEYWEQKALPQAQTAINESGILPVSAARELSVTQIFEYKQATPLQMLAEQIPISNNGNLFIIEEVTGAGKTEAALILAHRLMAGGYADGLYFGLPTMATANAMHERVEQVYRKLFIDASNPALVLAHSASRQYLALENSAEESVDGDDSENAQIDAKAWLYDNRKKALLAHVGVGTIDQALLAILPARHQSLRLLGLYRKVLIVDEVHAYDSYMNKLLCTLLKFYAAQGGSAILLSATLPVCARKQFLSTFAEGKGDNAVLSAAYPLVTGIAGTDFSENAVESPVELHREVKADLVYREDDVTAKIKAAVDAGNNICWIRNTVFDAQTAYEAVRKYLNPDKVILFHAKYTLGDRLVIEKQIMEQFGKNSNAVTRNGKMVIATQVVEQSLDIDFDCMITDLAPIDLIIQRAGRLCRHARDERGNRINGMDKRGIPGLIVFAPPLIDEPKANWYKEVFPKAAGVYEHHGQLWRTAQWLDEHNKFRMPQDARDMIEFVYGENTQGDIPESLRRQEDKAGGNDRAAAGVGQFQALNLKSGYMPDSLKWLDDEKAPTRLGDIRITVRLARWDGNILAPFLNSDWRLSEVSVARYWIAQEDEDSRKAIDAAKALMPDKGKFCVVVPVVEKEGVFYGNALNASGSKITILYDSKTRFSRTRTHPALIGIARVLFLTDKERQMNLINDVWIPVRRKNGKKIKIAPGQITEGVGTDNEIIELAAVRPDFNGALIQFLIGLLQTTCAPKENSDWRSWFDNPPSTDELKSKFKPISFAFNLDGDGPRFMQDLTIAQEAKKTEEEIEKLLIDAPGEQTLKQNKDLFIKRNRAKRLCWCCCAQALLTLQINAPSGGKGHRVGLRGGGPVNTVVLGDSLWQALWNNVLPENEFVILATAAKTENVDKFPWCAETRTSETDRATTPQDVYPAQVYWSMPRRIRLDFVNNQGKCDLCHEFEQLVESYYTKPYGVKYDGFVHPLTPTYKNKDGMILPVHQHESLGYKHWLGYVQNTDEGAERARVVTAAFGKRLNNFRLWAFGYDMDNMKACCWYEGVMPVIFIENETQWEQYNAEIATLIIAADKASDYLSKAVVKALNAAVFNNVRQRFWQETEPEFYRQIAFLRGEVMRDKDGLDVRRAWHNHLIKKALDIFNDMSQAEMIEDVNAERVAKAHNELIRDLNGKKLKVDILGLPK